MVRFREQDQLPIFYRLSWPGEFASFPSLSSLSTKLLKSQSSNKCNAAPQAISPGELTPAAACTAVTLGVLLLRHSGVEASTGVGKVSRIERQGTSFSDDVNKVLMFRPFHLALCPREDDPSLGGQRLDAVRGPAVLLLQRADVAATLLTKEISSRLGFFFVPVFPRHTWAYVANLTQIDSVPKCLLCSFEMAPQTNELGHVARCSEDNHS